ncbi:MAG: hypothetical protein D6832_00845 [Alphaproteobacteria bacterium]|nr:MAG: hypothetical protein D6832_00845 [Alphaproteobacteria bacterium]
MERALDMLRALAGRQPTRPLSALAFAAACWLAMLSAALIVGLGSGEAQPVRADATAQVAAEAGPASGFTLADRAQQACLADPACPIEAEAVLALVEPPPEPVVVEFVSALPESPVASGSPTSP